MFIQIPANVMNGRETGGWYIHLRGMELAEKDL
jgi:hypothetical protein